MPMSSGGRVASSSGCATKPKAREIGWTGYAGLTQHSLRIGHYVMATAEHREPCDSRGSCTVLGAPGGEIPPGDSAVASDRHAATLAVCPLHSESGQRADIPVCPLCANSVLTRCSKKALLFDHLSASASGAAAIIPRAAVRQSTIVKNK